MVHIKDFYADDVGKLYRSCGNCENNRKGRSVIVENSHVSNIKACAVGVNGNYGGKLTFDIISVAHELKQFSTDKAVVKNSCIEVHPLSITVLKLGCADAGVGSNMQFVQRRQRPQRRQAV
jgi:hypothetical protein